MTRSLFSAEEAFARLGQTRESGCLVIVSELETFRIFAKEGAVINAFAEGKEGQGALDICFANPGSSYVWIPEATPPKEKIKVDISGYILKNAVIRDVHFAKTSRVRLDSVKAESRKIVPTKKAETPSQQYHLIANDETARRIAIDRPTMIIGREESCDIVIVHPQISRRHCLLQLMVRGLAFRDLNSTNGITVNGFPATEGFVQAEDRFGLGSYSFTVHRVN